MPKRLRQTLAAVRKSVRMHRHVRSVVQTTTLQTFHQEGAMRRIYSEKHSSIGALFMFPTLFFVKVNMHQTEKHSFKNSWRDFELIIALEHRHWTQPLTIWLGGCVIFAEAREVNRILKVSIRCASFHHHRLCVEAKNANRALRDSILTVFIRRADFVLFDAAWWTAVVHPSVAVVHRLGVSSHDGHRPRMFVLLQKLDQALKKDQRLIFAANLLHPRISGEVINNNLPRFQSISRKEDI